MNSVDLEIELVVADDCPACERAGAVWREVCARRGIAIRITNVDAKDRSGARHRVTVATVPAVLVGGAIVAVGLQSPEQAQSILDRVLNIPLNS
jgi:predicted thioredoxin/glutaredoxin